MHRQRCTAQEHASRDTNAPVPATKKCVRLRETCATTQRPPAMRNDTAALRRRTTHGLPTADSRAPRGTHHMDNEGDIAQLPPPVCTALAAVLLRILHTRRLSKAQERARKGAWVWVAKERNRCTKEHTRSRSSNPAQDAALEASSQRAMLLPFPRGSRSTRCSAAGVSTSVAAAEWPAAPSPPRNG